MLLMSVKSWSDILALVIATFCMTIGFSILDLGVRRLTGRSIKQWWVKDDGKTAGAGAVLLLYIVAVSVLVMVVQYLYFTER